MSEISFRFDRHGLGDVVHAAYAVQLFRKRGYNVNVKYETNKRFVWKVAGVKEACCDPVDHAYFYPPHFDDLTKFDHDANKVCHFFVQADLPRLGNNDVVWDELCGIRLDSNPFISDLAWNETDKFLEGLPHPIVCFHSRGTNWSERKSIDTETAMQFQMDFVRKSPGSVVVLDWDARAPMIGHERVRGIRPSWGMIDPEQLCALYHRSDLMVGVDSGPFHLAAMTPIKALGVFRRIHPVRCCIPNPNAAYMVSRLHHDQWVSRQARWRFVEYFGEEPVAEDISSAAISILDGTFSTTKLLSTKETDEFAGMYVYDRVGHDVRDMELQPGGLIGQGRADCEMRWSIEGTVDTPILTIHGRSPTCRLKRDEQGVWRGRWIHYEQMPIALTPKG